MNKQKLCLCFASTNLWNLLFWALCSIAGGFSLVYKSEWFPLRLLFSAVTVTLHCVVPQLWFGAGKIICRDDHHDSSYPRIRVLSSLCNVTPAFTIKGWKLFCLKLGLGLALCYFWMIKCLRMTWRLDLLGPYSFPLPPSWISLPREEVPAILLRGYVEGIWGTQADSFSQYLDFEAAQDKLVSGRPPIWRQTHDRA